MSRFYEVIFYALIGSYALFFFKCFLAICRININSSDLRLFCRFHASFMQEKLNDLNMGLAPIFRGYVYDFVQIIHIQKSTSSCTYTILYLIFINIKKMHNLHKVFSEYYH